MPAGWEVYVYGELKSSHATLKAARAAAKEWRIDYPAPIPPVPGQIAPVQVWDAWAAAAHHAPCPEDYGLLEGYDA